MLEFRSGILFIFTYRYKEYLLINDIDRLKFVVVTHIPCIMSS